MTGYLKKVSKLVRPVSQRAALILGFIMCNFPCLPVHAINNVSISCNANFDPRDSTRVLHKQTIPHIKSMKTYN